MNPIDHPTESGDVNDYPVKENNLESVEDAYEEMISKIEGLIEEIEIDSEGLFSSKDARSAAIKIISLLSKQSPSADESKGLKSKEEILVEVLEKILADQPLGGYDNSYHRIKNIARKGLADFKYPDLTNKISAAQHNTLPAAKK